MKRQKNHERLLADYIIKNLGKLFSYGKFDCVIMLKESLKIIYGKDVFPELPKWKNKKSAIKLWKENGGIKEFLKKLGAKEIDSKELITGDIIIKKFENKLFQGSYIVFNRRAFGVVHDDVSQMFEISELQDDDNTYMRL